MTLVFTLCFLSYSFLVGKFYDKMHISRTVMIVICTVMTAILAAVFFIDLITTKRESDQSRGVKD